MRDIVGPNSMGRHSLALKELLNSNVIFDASQHPLASTAVRERELHAESGDSANVAGERIPGLDGLRGIAILWVILFHAFLTLHDPPDQLYHSFLGRVALSGWLGVDVFFVLSGFLITGILWDSRHVPNRVRNFYARRTLRIFPVYYAFLFVMTVAALTAVIKVGPSWSNWTYLSNFARITGVPSGFPYAHLWSLAVEEQYYLVWPWLIFRVRALWAKRTCIALLTASVAGRGLMAYHGQHFLAYSLTPFHLDGLVIGSWIALGFRTDPGLLRRAGNLALALSVLSVGALAIWRAGLSFYDPIAVSVGILAVSGLVGSALVRMLSHGSPRILTMRPLTAVGKYSYAMYLFHWPIFIGLNRGGIVSRLAGTGANGTGLAVLAFLAASLSFALAVMSWYVLEEPFLRLKRFFPVTTRSPAIERQS